MAQYGFYFDQTVCAGCHTCQIACKDKNRLEVGTLYRKVITCETGEYPNPGIYHLATACNHCDNPACVAACPTKRTVKDAETGLVCHDDNIKCLGEVCQMCVKACPYGHPVYVPEKEAVGKCNGCIELVRDRAALLPGRRHGPELPDPSEQGGPGGRLRGQARLIRARFTG